MNPKLKNALQYIVLLLFTAGLLWYALSSIEVKEGQSRLDFILGTWALAEKKYLLISAMIALISHILRSERWKILLHPLGYRIRSLTSFFSVMVGYFINLAIPRGGEVSRCYNLYRLERVPVNVSLGSVIGERVVDLMFLLLFICGAFILEFDNLYAFFDQLSWSDGEVKEDSGGWWVVLLVLVGLALAGTGFILIFYKLRRRKALKLLLRIKYGLIGLKQGAMSVFRLERKFAFLVYSLLIWFCYYLMTYFILLAFTETAEVGMLGAVTIFTIGGIAMTIPLPGGMGSYHILIPLGLQLLYGLDKDLSVGYTFVLHGWQTLVIIVFGVLSLVLSQVFSNQKTK